MAKRDPIVRTVERYHLFPSGLNETRWQVAVRKSGAVVQRYRTTFSERRSPLAWSRWRPSDRMPDVEADMETAAPDEWYEVRPSPTAE